MSTFVCELDRKLSILPLYCRLKKRCKTWEFGVKFYLGQNEDCSPGGSVSDSCERRLQSSSGGRSLYKVLVKGEFNIMKHSVYKRFFVVSKNLMSGRRNLVPLYIWGDARMEIIKSVPKNVQPSEDLSHRLPWSTECLTPPWTPSGAVDGQQL